MLQEFKTFIMKGNVLDLAVGVIIGAAFGKIVNSAVTDLIMPVVGFSWARWILTTSLSPCPASAILPWLLPGQPEYRLSTTASF